MKKGTFGYLQGKRMRSLCKSALLLAAVFIIFFAALHHFHTNRNVFSILAAVGALPAGRSIVETIMCFRARGASEAVRAAVDRAAAGESGTGSGLPAETSAYDLYLTSYERAFSLSHAAAGNGRLIGLTEDTGTDCGLCERHILDMLRKEGLRGYRVEVFRDIDAYAEELKNLVRQPEQDENARPLPEGERDENARPLPEREWDEGAEPLPEQEREEAARPLPDREDDRKAMALLRAISL